VDFVDNFPGFSEKINKPNGEEKKSQKLSTKSTNSHNKDTDKDTGVDFLSTNSPQSPQSPPNIQIGSTVKIHCKGSMRDGEIGTVISIDSDNFAQVRLHKQLTRRDLQIVPVPIVKESGREYYLELIE